MLRNLGSLAFALVLACLVAAPAVLAQSTGKLSGRVTDELGEPLPGANVLIEGTQLGAATNIDGEYFVIGIPVGEYTVTASFVGFGTQTIEGVQVSSGYTTEQNFELASGEQLGEIVVEYEAPIIRKDAIGVPKVITGEQIQNLPVRGVTSVAALQSGIVSNEGSGTLNVRGGRGEEVDYYVDGVRVTSGAIAVNQQAIQEQEVLIGTIPARYGDAMSGVISITTKSGGNKFFGSFEAITSEVLDDFGYNVATLSLGGPILPERASFFFSLSGQLLRDASPYGVNTLRLSDSDFGAFQQNPQVFRVVNAQGGVDYVPIPTDIPSGTPLSEVIADPDRFDLDIPDGFVLDVNSVGTTQIIPRSETVTRGRYDFEEQLGKDDPRRELTFNGNVTLNPLSTVSLRLGGVFELSDTQGYSFGRSLFARDRYYNSDNETYRGYLTFRQRLTDAAFYQVQAEYQNYQNWLFPEGWNRDIENTLFYGDVEAPQNAVARSYYSLAGSSLIRPQDGRFIGGGSQFFSGPGSVLTFYQKRDFEQFRFSGSATAQLGLHQVEFGAEFEQRTNRFFSLAANELSRYFNDGDAEAASDDDNGGLGYESYDELPFDAFGNGSASRSIVYRYYGYSYNGLEEVNSQDIDCFGGCDTDGDGEPDEFNYDVEPYKPIYYAGYVSDKIEYRDLVIQLGLRVDVFDNNTQVPFDLYTPFPIVRAGSGLLGNPDSDFYNPNVDTNGDGMLDGYAQPGGVGDDDAVYFDGSGNVVGYRDLDGNFFDADGEAIDFDVVVDDLAGNVRALPGEVLGKVDSDAFVDYEPRVTVMPRVGVSFPVTDRALFFASYNVTSQRPSEAAFTPFSSYNALGTDRLSNSNLSPETTTQYELGFRQRVGERAAVTLSGFYRTQDNKIQVRTLFGSRPEQYDSFLNTDFTTTKGVEVEFDLRRTQNLAVNANYTLSFAQGTGSDAGSAGAIAWRGGFLPNFISPTDFDRRHTANVSLDYRLGEGEGPEVLGARVLQNFGFNVLTQFRSGQPFTPLAATGPLYSTNSATQILGGVNEVYLPSSTLINLRLDRSFNLGPASLKAYLWVQNLLDDRAILNVYRFTGQPDDDGFLQTPAGQEAIETSIDSEAFLFGYDLVQTGPLNETAGGFGASGGGGAPLYGLPRRVRLGLLIDF